MPTPKLQYSNFRRVCAAVGQFKDMQQFVFTIIFMGSPYSSYQNYPAVAICLGMITEMHDPRRIIARYQPCRIFLAGTG